MAIIKQGILGGFSGKIGNIVGSSWKGIAIMKTKPLSVANPKTAAQVAQRTAFSESVTIATQILADVIKPLWDRFSVRKSGYNGFIQYNIGNIRPQPDLAGKVRISNGAMATTPITLASIDSSTGSITVNWDDDSGVGLKLATDEAYVVVMSMDNLSAQGFPACAIREEELAEPVGSNFKQGETYWVYLAFRRTDGTVVNQSSAIAVVAS